MEPSLLPILTPLGSKYSPILVTKDVKIKKYAALHRLLQMPRKNIMLAFMALIINLLRYKILFCNTLRVINFNFYNDVFMFMFQRITRYLCNMRPYLIKYSHLNLAPWFLEYAGLIPPSKLLCTRY